MSGSFAGFDHTSVNKTFTLRFMSAQRGVPLEQLVRARVSAMVSPASGENAGLLFGNGWPVAAAPLLTALKSPERPCERGFCAVGGWWQPMHVSTSPGRTCSQLSCKG